MKQIPFLTDHDLYLFNEGSHFRLYHKLGAHLQVEKNQPGARFAVWAPDAESVSVVGDFNGWDGERNRLSPHGHSGIWEGFLPGVAKGDKYKFRVRSRYHGYQVDKADPMGFVHEAPPKTASVVWDLAYTWGDAEWMKSRATRQRLNAPMSIYEVHIGSWRRVPAEGNRPLTYLEMAEQLPRYVKELGFTHVEFLPVMEHPFYGSWGYQVTGYFAPTSRYGSPQDFMRLVDALHQAGIGVVLDWVPSHFPTDEHGLGFFDGTDLYEHADDRKGFHPDWKSLIFNYGRNEVRSFLISSGLFWIDCFHADALRVDAVASMLYLDYSRQEGEWIPNPFGGRENLEAIQFLRRFNEEVYKHYPDVQTIAEESTAWPMVSRPVYVGGLGFGMKWDMGWMHDTLGYLSRNPLYRRYHHNELTFRMLYAFTENYVLPLSHDEVVHGKGSLMERMPGDDWQRFANLRLLYGNMFAQPGKKLLFMGGEFGQWNEWYHETSLDWHLLDRPEHAGVKKWVADLNRLYRAEPVLHERDGEPGTFEWVDCQDADNSVLVFLRKGAKPGGEMLVALNHTPVPRTNYLVGVPHGGFWTERLNSDAREYGGSGMGNLGGVTAQAEWSHGRPWRLAITLPPLAVVFLQADRG